MLSVPLLPCLSATHCEKRIQEKMSWTLLGVIGARTHRTQPCTYSPHHPTHVHAPTSGTSPDTLTTTRAPAPRGRHHLHWGCARGPRRGQSLQRDGFCARHARSDRERAAVDADSVLYDGAPPHPAATRNPLARTAYAPTWSMHLGKVLYEALQGRHSAGFPNREKPVDSAQIPLVVL